MDVLMVDGFHVPLMPLVDVVGNVGAVAFWQRGAIAVNVGVTWVVTAMVMLVAAPHWPGFGVNI